MSFLKRFQHALIAFGFCCIWSSGARADSAHLGADLLTLESYLEIESAVAFDRQAVDKISVNKTLAGVDTGKSNFRDENIYGQLKGKVTVGQGLTCSGYMRSPTTKGFDHGDTWGGKAFGVYLTDKTTKAGGACAGHLSTAGGRLTAYGGMERQWLTRRFRNATLTNAGSTQYYTNVKLKGSGYRWQAGAGYHNNYYKSKAWLEYASRHQTEMNGFYNIEFIGIPPPILTEGAFKTTQNLYYPEFRYGAATHWWPKWQLKAEGNITLYDGITAETSEPDLGQTFLTKNYHDRFGYGVDIEAMRHMTSWFGLGVTAGVATGSTGTTVTDLRVPDPVQRHIGGYARLQVNNHLSVQTGLSYHHSQGGTLQVLDQTNNTLRFAADYGTRQEIKGLFKARWRF